MELPKEEQVCDDKPDLQSDWFEGSVLTQSLQSLIWDLVSFIVSCRTIKYTQTIVS